MLASHTAKQTQAPTCWVVCDAGKIGTQNQCVGLAEALGYTPRVVHVKARFPWTLLPAHLWPCPLKGLAGVPLTPPWPDLIIAAGRAAVAPTAAIRKLTNGKTRVVQMQNPRVDPGLFDAVIAPRHDRLQGETVIETKGALHRVTEARLREETQRFEEMFKGYQAPYTAVLIGGTNRCYHLRPQEINALVNLLRQAHARTGGTLLVTISRRTAPENIVALKAALQNLPAILWDGEGDNPYFAYLGKADHIVVTSDSVSMTSEACVSGAPVYVYHLPGGSRKFIRFHDFFQESGYTRPFKGILETWKKEPLQEMDSVLRTLKDRLA